MKPPETIDTTMLAPCGLNCMLCYRHLGKKPCPGCRARLSEPDEYQRKCIMRSCVQERGLFSCAACADRPCKRMKVFGKRYREGYGVDLAADAEKIREVGVEVFLRDQIAAYTCDLCGHLINMHDGICSGCTAQHPIGKGRTHA
ncbi:MAG TPA: DUF3795 domain-containing protein [Clostridia bacterium]|nr:DUF3795 domain-containing protein [Clostridia bacterium]